MKEGAGLIDLTTCSDMASATKRTGDKRYVEQWNVNLDSYTQKTLVR